MNITAENLIEVSGVKAGQRAILKDGKAILVGMGGRSASSSGGAEVRAGVVVNVDGVLMVQPLVYNGTTPSDDGEPVAVDAFYAIETGKDAPEYSVTGGGSDVSGSTEFYKCASVTEATEGTPASWSGNLATLTDDVYSFSDTVTTGLPYGKGYTPIVEHIYDKEALIEVKQLFTGVYLVSPTGMTADSNAEWAISCSTTRTHAYEAFNGIEDGSSYGWESGDYTRFPHWLQWQNKLKKVQIVTYEMRPNNHVDDMNLERFPDSWTLQGSQDGQKWLDIDTRSNAFEDYTKLDMTKYYSFTCQNPGYYYYYRIYITKNAKDDNGYAYIGQLRAYGSFEGAQQ